MLISSASVSLSQVQSALKLYPMGIGDFWQYHVVDSTSYGDDSCGYSTVEIIGDTVCPNGKTYRFWVTYYFPQGWSVDFTRIDSSTACVYHYDYTNSREMIGDSLNMKVGDSVLTDGSTDELYCNKVDTESILGADCLVKGFYRNHGGENPTVFKTEYSAGIGMNFLALTNITVPADTIWNIWTLDYARINGISFGTMAGVMEADQEPGSFNLSQNYPNPMNPSTRIDFQIPRLVHATLAVYDVLGRKVVTLVDGVRSPGQYNVTFDGSQLPSGVYFYKLRAGSFVQVRKLMIIK